MTKMKKALQRGAELKKKLLNKDSGIIPLNEINVNTNEIKNKQKLSVIEILKKCASSEKRLMKKTEWLVFDNCKNFLVKGSINIFSADSGVGKTWLSLYLGLKYLAINQINRVVHFNLDGNPNIYLARNLLDEVLSYKKTDKWISIDYESLSEADINEPKQLLEFLSTQPADELNGTLMILDSLGNFVGDTNDSKSIIDFFKTLRILANKGVTFIINTHNKKNEAIFSGSGAIKNYSDSLYSFRREIDPNDENKWNIILKNQKSRNGETSQFFIMDLAEKTLISTTNFIFKSKEQKKVEKYKDIINQIIEILKQHPTGLNQSELFKFLDRDRTDLTLRNIIKEYTSVLWKTNKIGCKLIISLLENLDETPNKKPIERTEIRKNFVNKMIEILKQYPNGLNQSELFKKLGRERKDKTLRKIVKEYENSFWKVERTATSAVIKLL